MPIEVTKDEYIAIAAKLTIEGKENVLKTIPKPEIEIKDYFLASGLKKDSWCKALDISISTWDKYACGDLPVKPARLAEARRIAHGVRAITEGWMQIEHEADYRRIYRIFHPHPEQELKELVDFLKQEKENN